MFSFFKTTKRRKEMPHKTLESTLDRVRKVCENVLNQLGEEMDPETTLVDLSVTDDDLIQLAIDFEEEFCIDTTALELKKCLTIGDLITLIDKKRNTP